MLTASCSVERHSDRSFRLWTRSYLRLEPQGENLRKRMASRSAYRPLPSTPPTHSPHGSVASSRSRTPGQLSLHDYRKRQASPAPAGVEPAGGSKRTVKRKGGLPSFRGPGGSVPNGPPTPPHCEDDEYDSRDGSEGEQDEEEDDDAAIDRFLSGARARRAALRRAEGERMEAAASGRGLGVRHGLATDRGAAWESTVSAPAALLDNPARPSGQLGITKPEVLPPRPHAELLSPPPSPTTPLLSYHHSSSSLAVNINPPSSPHRSRAFTHFNRADRPRGTSFQPYLGRLRSREPEFNPIKRLPRPSQLYSPLVPSPLSSNPPSLTHTRSSNSPFDLSNVNFPHPPAEEALPTPAWPLPDRPLFSTSTEKEQESASLSELLNLYGSSFELLNRHDSLSGAHISASSSKESSPTSLLLPSLLPTTIKAFGMSNPFLHPDDPSREEVRESVYDDEAFDSRSIAPRGEDPPAMIHGFKDYPALLQRSHNAGGDHVTQRLPGRPPLKPAPSPARRCDSPEPAICGHVFFDGADRSIWRYSATATR